MDIVTWLRGLSLERYAEAFRANEVTPEALPELTDADLRELGLPLGPRKVLLKAIRDLTGLPPAADPGEPAQAQARPDAETAVPGPKAERRQLTVMFVDLVGSTTLSAKLDPEDMREVIREYQNVVASEITRFEGHVSKFMGDGVLAYFGWPSAHEDDAERAARAGLSIAERVAGLKSPDGTPIAARIGVATGLVVVGELVGDEEARERAVVGETPNLAARLQTLAEPGAVIISAATRRLVGGLFELIDLGPQRLKGFAEPLAAWRVKGEGLAEGRFEALHGERLTPLVGREHELGILIERWAWAKDGDGQIVLLAGDPGIGKSRLIRALRERLGVESYTQLSHYCSPYHTNSALYPVIGLLERAARLDRHDPPEAQLAKLEALLSRSGDRMEVVPLIAALLGVSTGKRYPPLSLAPEVQKRRTFEALVDQLAGLAAQQPVLALYEDVHWIDPSTLEFLGMVTERVHKLPVLVLITFRPEFQPPWTGHAPVTTLTMSRLGRRQGSDLVARVTGDKPLPAEIIAQIVARTDGVPLFVEELTKTVLESGLLVDAGDHYELSGPLPPLAIPTTLHDSLMARLDRLAPVKEVAQIGAVIGREFSHELLAALSPLPEDKLGEALDQLVASELVFRRGAPLEAIYTFKHALVQDAAYQSLLKSRRQQLHARIAQVLKEKFPQTEETEAGLLAHHCTEGGLRAQAATYWQRASEQAAERSAYAEALAQADKGLAVLEGLPATPDRDRTELKLQLIRAGALRATAGPSFPEVGRAFARARQLCASLGDMPNLIPILIGMGAFHHNRDELHLAEEIGAECLRLARHRRSNGLKSLVHRFVGSVLFDRGKPIAAREHLEQAVDRYDPERLRPIMARFGLFDPKALGLAQLAHALCILGYPDQALAAAQDAIEHAKALGDALNLANVMYSGGMTLLLRRDYDAAHRHAERMLTLAGERGLPAYSDFAAEHRGMALVGLGLIDEGLTAHRNGLKRRIGYAWRLTFSLGMLAHALLAGGRLEEAETVLQEALAVCERTGEAHFTSELYRLKSELLLRQGGKDPLAAEDWLTKALELSRQQSARLWELRAATSLARLWAEQGERQKAEDLLAPVYGRFTEGFDTQDLGAARTLLNELGSPTSSAA
jgi:class 3 adenylate cyclase/predicted ATPase